MIDLHSMLICVKDLFSNFLWIVILFVACLILFNKESNDENTPFFKSILSYTKTSDNRKEFTYKIHNSKLDPNFAKKASQIIKDSKWNESHNIREISNDSEEMSKINVYLVERSFLDKYHDGKDFYPDGRPIRFSITLTKNRPDVYIDGNNWLYGVKDSGLTLEQYKQYVILHEFGHALGYDHQPCNSSTAVNGVCPVLYQSTRGCPKGFKCGYQIVDADYTNLL
jgi:hypothetical protein